MKYNFYTKHEHEPIKTLHDPNKTSGLQTQNNYN